MKKQGQTFIFDKIISGGDWAIHKKLINSKNNVDLFIYIRNLNFHCFKDFGK